MTSKMILFRLASASASRFVMPVGMKSTIRFQHRAYSDGAGKFDLGDINKAATYHEIVKKEHYALKDRVTLLDASIQQAGTDLQGIKDGDVSATQQMLDLSKKNEQELILIKEKLAEQGRMLAKNGEIIEYLVKLINSSTTDMYFR